jgi:hypothetical protein
LKKVVTPRPFELRNLRTLKLGGSAVRTGRNETRFVLSEVKFQLRSSSRERAVQFARLALIPIRQEVGKLPSFFEIRREA